MEAGRGEWSCVSANLAGAAEIHGDLENGLLLVGRPPPRRRQEHYVSLESDTIRSGDRNTTSAQST
jgi:hypothetical protein